MLLISSYYSDKNLLDYISRVFNPYSIVDRFLIPLKPLDCPEILDKRDMTSLYMPAFSKFAL
jgi:hypothetical protein